MVMPADSGFAGQRRRRGGLINRILANPGFQSWASKSLLTRGKVRRDGDKIFDIVSGFVQSQILFALVALNIPDRLLSGSASVEDLASETAVPPDRLVRLLDAGVALGLLKRKGRSRYKLARLGAALIGVPGLQQMIRHHDVLYRDLADPVSFLRGETNTELADFWPYVFGAAEATDPHVTQVYSDLMADSQGLVAEDTLRTVDLKGTRNLLDVGGGVGVFARAVASAYPEMRATVLDLPKVIEAARRRPMAEEIAQRVIFKPGSFRDQELPGGHDAVSFIRVFYDHDDSTVQALLSAAWESLPPGGRLIVSEPMSGGKRPDKAGDVYFAFYTMAMRTGQTRSQKRIAQMCKAAGFIRMQCPRSHRPFVTSVVTAVKPE